MMGSNDDVRSVRSSTRRLSRYDILLWVIPLAFLLALVAATLLSAPRHLSFVVASLVGVLALFDGLFRNPPTIGTTA